MTEENLGKAVLTIEIRDQEAKAALGKLRQDIDAINTSASSVGKSKRTATDPAETARKKAERAADQAANKRVSIQNRLNILEAKGVDVTAFRLRAAKANEAAQESQFDTARRINVELGRALSIEENRLRVTAAQTALTKKQEVSAKAIASTPAVSGVPSLPVVPGLPKGELARQAREADRRAREEQAASRRLQAARAAEAKSRREDIKGRISSGLIGGAFPLLFGQGPGAALGGLAGGVAGGGAFGFGASLVGTGIGASFDALIARSKELAEALRDPIAAFDQLKTSSALSSRGLETLIEVLIKSGQTAAAEDLIRADLTKNFNPVLASSLSQANDELARSFSNVQERLAALTAGPAIAFLQWLDDIIDRLPIQGPGGAQPGQLPTAQQGRETVKRGVLAQLAGVGLLTAGAALGTLALPGPGSVAGAGLAAGLVASTGTGALVAGTSARAAGERVPEDLATQQRTAAVQQEIEATQARRITLQKQLVALTGDEKSASAQIAQGQNVVAQAQKDILEAKKKFLSLPIDATPEEEKIAYEELKLSIAAARVEVEKLIAANNNQAKSLKRATDIRERTTGFTSSARQGAVLEDAAAKAREGYDKAKAATASAVGKDAIAAAQAVENLLGQAWRSASQDLADYNAELAFVATRQAQVNKLAADKVAEDIKAVQAQRQLLDGAQSLADIAIQQSTLTQIQSIEAAVNAARRREADLGNQITTARQRGDETLAADLVAQQKTAAAETRLELEKGAKALTEAGLSLRDNLRGAVVEFTRVRSDPQGLNRFLNPQQRQQRAEFDFRTLLPEFRIAQERFTQLTGQRAPEFRGPTAGVNEAIRNFIDSVQTEREVTRNLLGVNQAIATNTAQLNATNADLAAKIKELADKDWLVSVAVSGAEAAVTGNAINSAFPIS